MDHIVFLGLRGEALLNASAGTGIFLLFLVLWLETKAWIRPCLTSRISKIVATALICTPLFAKWFLSESVLLVTAMVMIIISSYYLFLRRRGI